MSHQIQFSHNWNNKLNNNIFTTIRKWDYSKEIYYKDSEEHTFEVMLNGEKQGNAKLIIVEVLFYKDIMPTILRLDTGKRGMGEIFEVFKKFGVSDLGDKVILLTFEKITALTEESK